MKYLNIIYLIFLLQFAHQQADGRNNTAAVTNQSISLDVKINNLRPGDTLTFTFFSEHYSVNGNNIPTQRYDVIVGDSRTASIKIKDTAAVTYFTLSKGKTYHDLDAPILSRILLYPGLVAKIEIDSIAPYYLGSRITKWLCGGIRFRGKDGELLQCQYDIRQLSESWERNTDVAKFSDSLYAARKTMQLPPEVYRLLFALDIGDSVRLQSQKILNNIKPNVSPLIFDVLRANIVGHYLLSKHEAVFKLMEFDTKAKASILLPYRRKFADAEIDSIPPEIAQYSMTYPDAVLEHFRYREKVLRGIPKPDQYDFLKARFSGGYRDRLLYTYLAARASRISPKLEAQFRDAIMIIGCPMYRRSLEEKLNSLSKGVVAKQFMLPNQKGEIVRLSDLNGKVVVMDFWYTGCVNCAILYKNVMAKVEKKYRDCPRVAFVTVSVDEDRDKWRQSIMSGKYTSENSINLFTDGKGSGHQIIKDYKVTGYPRPILISQDGKVLSANSSELRDKDKLEELIEAALLKN